MNLIRESILVHLSLRDNLSHEQIIELMESHGFTEEEVLDELENLIVSRRVAVKDMRIFHVETKPEEIDPAYLAAADAYRESKLTWVQRLRRCVANFLSCIVLSLSLTLSAQEMPAWTTVEITAYCPCVICCGDHADGKTANMTNVLTVPYNLAADRSLPMGTKIYIPLGFDVLDNVRKSDRYFSIDDRGGALDTESKKYRIIRLDLRVKEHSWAVKFGRKRIPVIINSVKDAGVK